MFKRAPKKDAVDINQDVSDLADTLENLLKSYSSKTKDEVDSARASAEALLKETCAKLHGPNRVTRAAKEAGEQVDSYVRGKPWYGVGIGAALGIFVGALIATTSSRD
ncbi:DUF883 family protein [Erwinia tracheiphila]|uniref:DUF883 family protein n=1 Tax=Erwinia tracheiphila TaxID=65700 RepID=A0A0M2KL47_9GAMM|nr:DUF883 family protein [Erwinia tracheiphila]AXF75159.1 DUF883 family protein [Erwinia tracheiphila]EOS94087.1 hypothetical protein ETR_15636 [Erwinia tracheiphila PSU-1]KKF38037.1 membrane protein [Erwinia tracheiphila]UIA82297.1 DUF883 family protein [Erwinia tracheiphila]UIA89428.1 DUF883 family protein [Erwinia tracheiphila]